MQTATIDEQRVQEFAQRLFGAYVESMLTLMINLAERTGLLEALSEGAGTSRDVAKRAGLDERYVRECLGALVTGGLVDYNAASQTYTLPAETSNSSMPSCRWQTGSSTTFSGASAGRHRLRDWAQQHRHGAELPGVNVRRLRPQR